MGGFDALKYVTERKWASAPDGTQIPVSIVYRKDLVKLDGTNPLLLYGYGSYEVIKYYNYLAGDWRLVISIHLNIKLILIFFLFLKKERE